MSPTPEPDPDPPCRTDTMMAPRPSPYCTLPSGSTRPSKDERRGAGGASRSDWFSAASEDSIGRGASSSRKSGLTGGLASAAHATPSTAIESSPSTESVTRARSEEHTSELQSRLHLVCRLLLEKKKKRHTTNRLPKNRLKR